jgi:hypothetical protein
MAKLSIQPMGLAWRRPLESMRSTENLRENILPL